MLRTDVSLDEALAIVQDGLTRGVMGFGGLMSEHQMNYAGAFNRVACLSADWSNRPGLYDQPLVRELRLLIEECAGSVNYPPEIHAINTTFYGKDTAMQDHSPQTIHSDPNRDGDLKPAVPVSDSVTDDYLICLEDGKRFKSLKRHLMTRYDLTPESYRRKWGLPADYPMVAPSYARARTELANAMGLRRK